MKIAVFVKHVPDTAEAELEVTAEGRTVKATGLPYQMNEWDRFALEEAVRWKEAAGGDLTAFLLGPEAHEDSLRRCLAVGADRAVRIWDPALSQGSPWSAASVLAAAVGGDCYDLYLTGAQADDDGYALVGPMLAQLLGVPSAALVTRIEASGDTIVCDRELEAGWIERVELDLPALVTVQTGINEPRYVSILGIRKARSRPVEQRDLAALGVEAQAVARRNDLLRLDALEPPPQGEQAQRIEGPPEEVARRVVALLGEKGGVL